MEWFKKANFMETGDEMQRAVLSETEGPFLQIGEKYSIGVC